jgi:hypothetical protein
MSESLYRECYEAHVRAEQARKDKWISDMKGDRDRAYGVIDKFEMTNIIETLKLRETGEDGVVNTSWVMVIRVTKKGKWRDIEIMSYGYNGLYMRGLDCTRYQGGLVQSRDEALGLIWTVYNDMED